MKLNWHRSLPGDLATAWDNQWQQLDLHPFQHRHVAIERARQLGRPLWFVTGDRQGTLVFGGTAILRPSPGFPPRLVFTRGPWAADEQTLVTGLSQVLTHWPTMRRPMTVRIDPHLPLTSVDSGELLRTFGYRPVPSEMHDRSLVSDLQRPPEAILKACRSGARQQIRMAERDLEMQLGAVEDVPHYVDMHNLAAGQKGYGQANAAWIRWLVQEQHAWLMLARHNGRLVGGGVFLKGSRTVHYLYGARDLTYKGPAFYGAFWALLQTARAHGLATFDLGGISDDDDGVNFFKRSWGAQEVTFTPEMEACLRPAWSRAFAAVRSLTGKS